MKTRMQPIDTVWSKLPRLVRDVSVACGREVRLELEGRETELDKTILEAIKDPLTHVVRNAVDHGIEDAGDPGRGRQAGRGHADAARVPRGRPGQYRDQPTTAPASIRREIAAKAIERGVATVEQLRAMSPREIVNLIFLPGFSTGDQGHQPVWSRRRHGRRAHQHREDRRHGRHRERAGRRHHAEDQDSVDAGDHSGADRRVCRRALRGSAGQPRRVALSRRRAGQRRRRVPVRRTGLPVARHPDPSGVARSRSRSDRRAAR